MTILERLGGDTECSKRYGDNYNATTDSCQCGSGPSCLFSLATAPFCDQELSICKCSESVEACNNPREKCVEGSCMCGASKSCDGSLTAPFCDAENHVCKCNLDRDACTNPGEMCVDGDCKCGTGETCKDSKYAPYCDAGRSTCKCSESVDACDPYNERCSDGVCQTRKLLKHFYYIVSSIKLFMMI